MRPPYGSDPYGDPRGRRESRDPRDPRNPRAGAPRDPYSSQYDPYDPYGRSAGDPRAQDPHSGDPNRSFSSYGKNPTDRRGSRRRTERTYGEALGITVLGAIVPGLGLVLAGKRRLGGIILGVIAALIALLGYLALFRQRDVIKMLADTNTLNALSPLLFIVGLAWVAVIVATHRAVRPWRISPLARVGGAGLVALLAIAVMLPMAVSSRYATVTSDVVNQVFADDENSKSETRPKNVSVEDPWGGRDRVNVLLLGGDGGKDRVGIRTDTVMVASINTKTGNTVLMSLPRNLEQVPFKPGSKLAKLYPDGIFDPGRKFYGTDEELEYMLTAMYENVPQAHPGVLDSDNPGADVLKEAVGEALGLQLDYYVLVNLQGFSQLINALGGITVNVNSRVPMGGDTSRGIEPHDWITPGKDKHLDGYHALWFARGRYGSNDYQRMHRQRCTMNAIIKQANPQKVFQRYEAIANASKQIVKTDIQKKLLPAFVDLSLKVKDGQVTSLVFDNKVIKPWRPDYDLIRSKVQDAIKASAVKKVDNAPGPAGTPEKSSTPTPKSSKSTDGSTSDEEKANRSIEESCAYHPGDE